MPRWSFLHLLSAPDADPVPDAELLRRVAATRDAAAFELLVRRHADAVWAAAYRVLRHHADAEDAFQAAFLVLARKAGSVRGASAGGWLHRVAVNAALKLKANRDRASRVGHDPGAALHPAGSPDPEVAAVVHQELARLPDRYRLPVVLCDLEGHSHAAAAKALGWPVGSVSGRLSRAHALLRDRLARRGFAPLVVAAAAAPPAVVHAAAGLPTAAAVSPVVSSLVEGVLSAMRTAKLKLTAAVAAGLLGLAGVGTVIAVGQGPAPGPKKEPDPRLGGKLPAPGIGNNPPPAEGDWVPAGRNDPVPTAFPDIKYPRPEPGKKPDREEQERLFVKLCPRILGSTPPAVEPQDDTYRKLLKARLNQGRLEVFQFREKLRLGSYAFTESGNYSRLLEDMRAVAIELWAGEVKSLTPWLEELVLLNKEVEEYTAARVAVGTDPPYALAAARRYRLAAEASLWKVAHPKPAPAGGR